MERKEKECLHEKIKAFKKLEERFNNFIELAKSFIEKDTANTFGLTPERKGNIVYFNGFGHSFFATWRFLIDNDVPIGELNFYRNDEIDKEKFFTLFYEAKGNTKKNLGDQMYHYYLVTDDNFEDLFFDIIKHFLDLQCFKA